MHKWPAVTENKLSTGSQDYLLHLYWSK